MLKFILAACLGALLLGCCMLAQAQTTETVTVAWQPAASAAHYVLYVGPKGAETRQASFDTGPITVAVQPGQCIYVQPVDTEGTPVTQPSNEWCYGQWQPAAPTLLTPP
jgi:hypothetical protein